MGRAREIIKNNEVAQIEPGKELEFIFREQVRFLKHLSSRGSATQPGGVDINSKEGQKVIRDMGTRFIEELAECFDHAVNICTQYAEVVPTPDRDATIVKELLLFNEEVSDALHFGINLLIYSGYDEESLSGSYNEFMQNDGMTGYETMHGLVKMFSYARYVNIYHQYLPQAHMGRLNKTGDAFIWGGRYINGSMLPFLKEYLWDITHQTYKLINLLKHRAWRLTATETSHKEYHLELLKVWGLLMGLLDMMGYCPESVGRIYAIKNKINWERQYAST